MLLLSWCLRTPFRTSFLGLQRFRFWHNCSQCSIQSYRRIQRMTAYKKIGDRKWWSVALNIRPVAASLLAFVMPVLLSYSLLLLQLVLRIDLEFGTWKLWQINWRCWSVLCCQSQQREKNRSSAPLKNCVSHTALVGLSIFKLVGSIDSIFWRRCSFCKGTL